MGREEAPKSARSRTADPVQVDHDQSDQSFCGRIMSSLEHVSMAPYDDSVWYSDRSEVLGIVGGMGPLASARFLESLYRLGAHQEEQNAPACILISNPHVVDRTQALENGQQLRLVRALSATICQLEKAGATRFVIACFTLHSVISELPIAWRRNIISLVDLLMELISECSEPHLVLCTIGTRRAQILETHPMWSNLKEYLVLPAKDDQVRIHDLIYHHLKSGRLEYPQLVDLERLANRYEVRHLAVACTEFHLLHDLLARIGKGFWSVGLTDPLLFLAQNLDRFLSSSTHVQGDQTVNGW